MDKAGMSETVVIGSQADLTIPPRIRDAMGLEPGSGLQLYIDGDRLVLLRLDGAVAAPRRLGCEVPAGRSLIAELLAERRMAADAD